jgi:hypothetical protein
MFMADRMAAEIWIGGKLPRSLLEEFPISDLCLDWDCNRLKSTSEADILAGRDENGLLHFADAEAAWGEFQELEGWLREHKVPFRRRTEGKYEHTPELVEFRPDLKGKRNREVYAMTSPEGAPMVFASEVEAITTRMAKLVADRKRSARQRLGAWEILFAKLLRVLPPQLPPLPPFEIMDI